MALLLLPVFAFDGYIIFRKLKYNFFEHLIINGFVLLGMFIMVLAAIVIEINNVDGDNMFFYYISNCVGYSVPRFRL